MAAGPCVAATVGIRQLIRAMILSEAMSVGMRPPGCLVDAHNGDTSDEVPAYGDGSVRDSARPW